jgi:hypothetical protein
MKTFSFFQCFACALLALLFFIADEPNSDNFYCHVWGTVMAVVAVAWLLYGIESRNELPRSKTHYDVNKGGTQ